MAIKSPKYFGVEINFGKGMSRVGYARGGGVMAREKLTVGNCLTVENSIAYKLRQGNSSTSSLDGSLAEQGVPRPGRGRV